MQEITFTAACLGKRSDECKLALRRMLENNALCCVGNCCVFWPRWTGSELTIKSRDFEKIDPFLPLATVGLAVAKFSTPRDRSDQLFEQRVELPSGELISKISWYFYQPSRIEDV